MLTKYLNPQNDIAFKRIFGHEKNKDILLALINSTLKKQLHRPIKETRLLPRTQDPQTAAKKTSVVDVICRDEDGCTYIIEMQVATSEGFKERAQYYASKAYISQANKGDKYSTLEKVIFLAFTNYPIFDQKQHHKTDHQLLDIVTHEQDLDRLAFTFVDLIKFDEQNKKSISQLTLEEKFYYFLRHAQDITPHQLEQIIENEPIIAKAFKELDCFYWTEQEIAMYEQQEKRDWDYRAAEYQRGVDEGEQRGEKKGIELGRKEGIQLGEKRGINIGRQEGRQQTLSQLVAKGIITQEEADKLKGG